MTDEIRKKIFENSIQLIKLIKYPGHHINWYRFGRAHTGGPNDLKPTPHPKKIRFTKNFLCIHHICRFLKGHGEISRQ